MSSALGDKKGRVADSSDLTRMRRNAAEIAAYATYTGLDVNKKMHSQMGTTKGILSIIRGAITTVEASTTGRTIDPIDRTTVWAPYSVPVYSSFSMIPNFNNATFVSSNATEPGNYIVNANGLPGYSDGNYTAVGSSFTGGNRSLNGAQNAFMDHGVSDVSGWDTRFRYSSGVYTGSLSTNVGGVNVSGEYLQITAPVSFVLSSYQVITSTVVGTPSAWVIAGSSNGGTTFDLLDTQTGLPNLVQLHPVSLPTNSNAYSTYRLIVTVNNDAPDARIVAWNLYQTLRTA